MNNAAAIAEPLTPTTSAINLPDRKVKARGHVRHQFRPRRTGFFRPHRACT